MGKFYKALEHAEKEYQGERQGFGWLEVRLGDVATAALGAWGHTILFVAANLGEGNTTAAIAIAKSLSEYVDARILLVDGNLIYPRLHQLFHLPISPGLSDLLTGRGTPLEDLIQQKAETFDIITSGSNGAQAFKKMTSNTFEGVMQSMRSRYDYVLFDMCPLKYCPSISAITSVFDGIIMVIACEYTRWEVAQNVKGKLQSSKANILGVILNKRRFYIPNWLYNFV